MSPMPHDKEIGWGLLCGGRANWNRSCCRGHTKTLTFSLFIKNPYNSVHIEMSAWPLRTTWPTMKNVHCKVCTSWIHGQVSLPCLPACKCCCYFYLWHFEEKPYIRVPQSASQTISNSTNCCCWVQTTYPILIQKEQTVHGILRMHFKYFFQKGLKSCQVKDKPHIFSADLKIW